MEIKLCDLHPNPFRRMDRYPIDRHKVEALKESIKQTGFWDNIIARPHPSEKGKYQLAYGHHRVIAVQETGQSIVNIPVRSLDDATMIQIMGNENLLQWGNSPSVLYETVLVAKEYLDGELSKYGSWEECPNKTIKALFTGTKGDFLHAKNQGVGQTTLLKFLGSNWKQHQIQEALTVLNNEELDRAACEVFPTVSEAQEFRKIMEKQEVPKDAQLEIATKVVSLRKERTPGTKTTPPGDSARQQGRRQFREDVKTVVPEHFEGIDSKLAEAEESIETLKQRIASARRAATDLNIIFQELNVEQINGFITKFEMLDEISLLVEELRPIMVKLGYDFTKKQENSNEIHHKELAVLH